MPVIEGLGHVGLYVRDLELMRAFYEDTLGLTVTDVVDEAGLVFMSARPESEHHELLLIRRVDDDSHPPAQELNQVSFRCPSLEDVHAFWQRLNDEHVTIVMTVSHGNAIGVYFLDPEGNTVEVYWDTGLKARQPWMDWLDLNQPLDEIVAHVRRTVAEYGDVGYVGDDPAAR